MVNNSLLDKYFLIKHIAWSDLFAFNFALLMCEVLLSFKSKMTPNTFMEGIY